MKLIQTPQHCYLQFEKLLPFKNVIHASFQKHGDLSFDAIKNTFGLKENAWIRQIHGNAIVNVAKAGFAGEADAFATGSKNIALSISHADCQAALIYDPGKHIAAAVHCGWRGLTQKIYTNSILFLKETYGCLAQDLIICISPSLGPESSEFVNFEKELPFSFHAYQCKPFYFDLWQISNDELLAAGILQKNIEIARICTLSHSNDYFSYRYDKTSKRLITLISLL